MKTLKDLLVAMVNATLILVALCLFLALKVSGVAERVTASFAQNLQIVEPLRLEVQSVAADLQGLRSDLDAMRSGAGEATQARVQSIEARLDRVQQSMDKVQAGFQNLPELPARLVDQAATRVSEQVVDGVSALRGCTRPSSG